MLQNEAFWLKIAVFSVRIVKFTTFRLKSEFRWLRISRREQNMRGLPSLLRMFCSSRVEEAEGGSLRAREGVSVLDLRAKAGLLQAVRMSLAA